MNEPTPTNWQENFLSIIAESLQGKSPDYYIQDRLVIDPDSTQEELTDFFVRAVDVLSVIDENELPNKYNKSATAMAALSLLASKIDPENMKAVVPKLQGRGESIGSIALHLPIRLLNDKGSPEVAAVLSTVNTGEIAKEVIQTSARLDPRILRDYVEFLIKVDPISEPVISKLYEGRRLRDEAQIIRQEEEQNALEERLAKQARDRVTANQMREFEGLINQSMLSQPDETFAWLLENMPSEFNQSQKDKALLPASRQYLDAFINGGTSEGQEWKFVDVAKKVFISAIENDLAEKRAGNINHSNIFISSVLGVVFPDQESLQAFVESHIDILNETEFFDAWHGSVANIRLQEIQNKLPREQCRQLLNSYNHMSVSVRVDRLGVEYDSQEELLKEIYEYFVANRADTISKQDAETHNARLGSEEAAKLIRWSSMSRTNSNIYTNDVEQPFTEFINGLDNKPAGTYVFKTPEAARGGTPYKYEATSFGDHAITVAVKKDSNGKLVYYLNIQGGGYSPDQDGRLLDRYAAYFKRDVMYPERPSIIIKGRPKLPGPFTWGFMVQNMKMLKKLRSSLMIWVNR